MTPATFLFALKNIKDDNVIIETIQAIITNICEINVFL